MLYRKLIIRYFRNMNKLFILLFLFITFFVSCIRADELEAGKWNFIVEDDYCYIGSTPINTEIEEGKKRDVTYILVYRINKNPDAIVQIEAGYPYDQKKTVEVIIDKVLYEFFSEESTHETAWTNNDKEVIFAMKKGITLIVKGYSSRGTLIIDTYTLNGFTAAYNNLTIDC